MSELDKALSEELKQALSGLPEAARTELQQRWTQQAIGAQIVAEIATATQPGT